MNRLASGSSVHYGFDLDAGAGGSQSREIAAVVVGVDGQVACRRDAELPDQPPHRQYSLGVLVGLRLLGIAQ